MEHDSASRADRAIWRTRGFLPHFDAPGEIQHIVFRLADSLPSDIARPIETGPGPLRLAAIEAKLDEGFGSRALGDPRVARLVCEALTHFHGERYDLHAWCVMPTHVHVLVLQVVGWPLASVVHSWKSFTANRANRLPARSGPFWSREYFDRAMRTEAQVARAFAYIEANPTSAGLCRTPEAWSWSSASWGKPAGSRRSGLEARAPVRGQAPAAASLAARDS
jgi:REP element-mobilizing transposase RayT